MSSSLCYNFTSPVKTLLTCTLDPTALLGGNSNLDILQQMCIILITHVQPILLQFPMWLDFWSPYFYDVTVDKIVVAVLFKLSN